MSEMKIKLLVWEERSGAHCSETAFGECIIDHDGDGFYVIENGRKHSEFGSLTEAKAFVQINHERHVLGWIEAAP